MKEFDIFKQSVEKKQKILKILLKSMLVLT